MKIKMSQDWSEYTKKQLTQICRQSRWKLYSRLNKQELVQFIKARRDKEDNAARYIQRWFRKNRGVLKQYRIVNDTDFVTLEKIDSRVKFAIRNHVSKQIFLFNPKHLMQFVLDTGQFLNPFTRDEIKDHDLLRLHNCYMKLNEEKEERLTYKIGWRRYRMSHDTNIIAVKGALARFRHEERERERLGLHLQGRCQNIIETILDMIINLPSPDVEVVTQVMSYNIDYHFTQFLEYFHNLVQFNIETSRQFLYDSISQILHVANNTAQPELIRSIANAVSKEFISHYNQVFEAHGIETMDVSD